MSLKQIWSVKNLDLAWKRITTGKNNAYKAFFRELYIAYETGLTDNLHDLHDRLIGGSYKPQSPCRIYLPKPSGLQRPLTLLAIEDQIVWQAIANAFARKVEPKRSKLAYRCIYSNIPDSKADSIFFLKRWQISYHQYQRRIEHEFKKGNRWVAHFDLAAYYDTICHDLLLRIVFPGSKDWPQWQSVMEWLKTWSAETSKARHAHGIPQGPIASDYFAECFFLPIDQILCKKIHYVRYVDDIRLFAQTEYDVRRAAIQMEIELRKRGLIPQGKKHAIVHAKSVKDALGSLPSIAPPPPGLHEPTSDLLLPKRFALARFKESLGGKPLAIQDKTRARFVLYRSKPSAKLTYYITKLLPNHPEHVDAFAFYLKRCRPSTKLRNTCIKALKASPYEYVQGEMYHILAEVLSPQQKKPLLEKAVSDAKSKAGIALKWGVCHFLCTAEKDGLGSYSRFVQYQKDALVQALSAQYLPDVRFRRNDVVEFMLKRTACEPGMALSKHLIRLKQDLNYYKIDPSKIPSQVRNVFCGAGLIMGSIPRIDPMGELLSRRYGITKWNGWRKLFGSEYSHALQCLAIADASFHLNRTQWLNYQNSFNHALILVFQSFLVANQLPGIMSLLNRNNEPNKFGSFVAKNTPFDKNYPEIAGGLRETNDTRNIVLPSHPYELKTGKKTGLLKKRKQGSLQTELANAYKQIIEVVIKTNPPHTTNKGKP